MIQVQYGICWLICAVFGIFYEVNTRINDKYVFAVSKVRVTRGYKDGLQPETLADGNWLVNQNQPVSKIETKSDTNLRSLYESWFRNALISKSVILWWQVKKGIEFRSWRKPVSRARHHAGLRYFKWLQCLSKKRAETGCSCHNFLASRVNWYKLQIRLISSFVWWFDKKGAWSQKCMECPQVGCGGV